MKTLRPILVLVVYAAIFGSSASAAPTINTQPGNIAVTAGTTTQLFSVAATGAGTLSYQWQRNGFSIAGATGSTFAITSGASRADADYYDVVVTDSADSASITSSLARLSVAPSSYPTLVVPDPAWNAATENSGGTGSAIAPIGSGAAVAPGGCYVGGTFTSVNGASQPMLFRVLANGALDTAFAPPVLDGSVAALAVQSDGKLVVGGSFFRVGGLLGRSYLIRLNTDGSLDTTFNPAVSGNVNAIVIQPADQRVVIGGGFTTVNGTSGINRIARLNTNGTTDTTFSTGTGFSGAVNALALQSDGSIVAGGSFTSFGVTSNINRLARLTSAGALDSTLNLGTGTTAGPDGTVFALAIQTDGKILLGGSFSNYNASPTVRLARISSLGALENGAGGFTTNLGSLVNNTVNAIALQADGKVLVGGSFTANGNIRAYFTRIGTDGTPDATAPATPGSTVNALAFQADGHILLGGSFSNFNGPAATAAATLSGTTVASIAVTSGGSGYASAPAVTVSGGGGTGATATATISGGVVTSINVTNAGTGYASAPTVSFSSTTSNPRTTYARLNSDMTLDLSSMIFTRNANNTVAAVLPLVNGKVIVAGAFTFVRGSPVPVNLVRFNSDGSLDSTFNPSGTVKSIAVTNPGSGYTSAPTVIIGTGATATASISGGGVTSINVTSGGSGYLSTPTVTFSGGGGGTGAVATATLTGGVVTSIAVSTAGTGYTSTPTVIIGTGATATATVIGGMVTSISVPSGGSGYTTAPAISFVGGGGGTGAAAQANVGGTGANNSITAAALLPDGSGRIAIAGNFTTYNGTTRNRIAIVNADGTLDTTFNSGGVVTSIAVTNGGSGYTTAPTVTIAPPGSGTTATAIATVSGGAVAAITITNPGNGYTSAPTVTFGGPGTLAAATATFGNNGTNGQVYTLAVLPAGSGGLQKRLFLGGSFTTVNNATLNRVAILNLDGSTDAGFNATGTGVDNNSVFASVLQPDGKIVIGGSFTSYNGVTRNSYIARIAQTGALDTSFVSTGTGFNAQVNALTLLFAPTANVGQIVAAGNFTTFNGTTANYSARLTATGTLDTTFTGANTGTNYGLLAQEDGNVLLRNGAIFNPFGTTPGTIGLVRLSVTNGARDTTFAAGSLTSVGTNYAPLAMLDNGKLFTAHNLTGLAATMSGTVPAITTQPQTQTATVGGSATFTVNATSPLPISYQWLFNGVPISGANGSTYTVNNVQLASVGSYSVVLSNESGSTTSTASATITGTNPTPTISGQPHDTSATVGTPISLSVIASGTDTLTYQWRRNGFAISGATSASYAITSAGQSDSDTYDVVVYDGLSAAVSNSARLTVTPTVYPNAIRIDPSFNLAFESDQGGLLNLVVPYDATHYLVAGDFVRVAGNTAIRRLARINSADGTLDPSFATNINGSPSAIIVLSTGDVVVGGYLNVVNGVNRGYLVRLKGADGSIDPTFNPGGSGPNNTVYAMVRQPADGKLIIGGNFTSYNGSTANRICRLNTDGTLDTTFLVGSAQGVTNTINTLALDPSTATTTGYVVAGGSFTSHSDGTVLNRIARFTTTGTRDTTFPSGTGTGFDNTVNVVAFDSVPSATAPVLVGGSFTAYGATTNVNRLVRLTSTGAIDASFVIGTGTTAGANGTVNSLFYEGGNTRWLVGGSFTSYNTNTSTSDSRLMRLSTGGVLDTAFTPNVSGTVLSIFVQSDASVVFGGSFTSVGTAFSRLLARVTSGGAPDTTLFTPFRAAGTVNRILPLPGGKFLVGGNFSHLGTTPARYLARLNSDLTVDLVYAPSGGTGYTSAPTVVFTGGGGGIGAAATATVNSSGNLIGVTLTAGGSGYTSAPTVSFSGGGGLGGTVTATISGGAVTALSFNNSGTGPNGTVIAAALQGDGKLMLAGNFTTFNGVTANRVMRLNADFSLDTTFNPNNGGSGPSNAVNAMTLLPGGSLYIGGAFTSVGTVARGSVARLLVDGTVDAAFNAGSTSVTVNALAAQPDGKVIVGGSFTTFNGSTRNNLVRLNTDGTFDSTIPVAGANGLVRTIVLQPDAIQPNGKIVIGGDFTTYNGTTSNYVARINSSDGAIDSTFPVGTSLTASVYSIVPQEDGSSKFIAFGNVNTTISGAPSSKNFARVGNSGLLDPSLNLQSPGTIFTSAQPSSLQVLDDGRVLVGTSVFCSSNLERTGLIRFIPAAAPTVTSLSATSVRPGASLTITGTDFTDVTGIRFGGVNGFAAPNFTVVSPTQITLTVPFGAVSGQVVVQTFYGNATAAAPLAVAPDFQLRNPQTTASSFERGIAYGNDTYVAVTLSGAIWSSPDGIMWTQRYSGPNGLNDIAYAAGQFVAVGFSGTLLTSPDGITWTQRVIFTTTGLNGVVHNGAKWLVVTGSSNTVLTSTDGQTWTTLTTTNGGSANAVAFGAGLFVAGAGSGVIRTSPDGVTWTSRTSNAGSSIGFNKVFFGNGQFVAVGTNGTIVTSPDGVTWTARASGMTSTLYSVAYGAGRFVIGSSSTTMLMSMDGITWTQLVLNQGNPCSIVYGNGQFVGAGSVGSVVTSPDGVTWTIRQTLTARPLRDVAYGNGRYVVVSSSGTSTYLASNDAVNWTFGQNAGGLSAAFNGVGYGNGLFVAVGVNAIATTADGVTWINRTPSGSFTLNGVAYGGGVFVAVGNGGVAYRSTDGVTWTSVTTGTANTLNYVAYGASVFTAVGGNGTVVTSPNGITWTPQTSNAGTNALNGVRYANNQFVAVGASSTVVTSPEGTLWTPRTLGPTGVALTSVAFGDGYYLALSSSSSTAFWVSTDASAWTQVPLSADVFFLSGTPEVIYGNGRFVVVSSGAGGLLVSSNPAADTLAITAQPVGQTITSGQTATLAVTATGVGLTYQWYRGVSVDTSTIITGAVAASYTTPALTASASYWVRVTNSAGATVDSATATVLGPPLILTQPQPQTAPGGGNASFSVAAIGSGTLTYQWQKDGINLVNSPRLSGATSANLKLSNVQAADAGGYTVIIGNGNDGPLTSSAGSLTVTPQAPVFGANLGGTTLVAEGKSFQLFNGYSIFTVNNVPSSLPTVTGSEPITYQWKKNGVDIGNGGTVSGADTASLTFTNVLPSDAGNYTLFVSNSVGNATSGTFTLAVASNARHYAFTTLAGQSNKGGTDGIGTAAKFANPQNMALVGTTLFIADAFNHVIRKLDTATGAVTTLAGLAGYPGSTDGTGSSARFNTPNSVAVDSSGNVYVNDNYNATIRKITPGGVVTTLAGRTQIYGCVDGIGSDARFNRMGGMVLDSAGYLYVTETGHGTIRKINTATGEATVFIGVPGQRYQADGTGSEAHFLTAAGLTRNPSTGDLYATDSGTYTVRKITPAGVVTTIAGVTSVPGSTDGVGGSAMFRSPNAIATDSLGNLFVADTGNHSIRKIASDGTVSTLAGTAGSSGSADGNGAAARFSNPSGIVVDGSGNLYVADTGNSTIRMITSAGVVTTIAGAPPSTAFDGTGSAARFGGPSDVALDSLGNAYVVDAANSTIRKITPAGVTTTLAGQTGVAGTANGIGTAAQFNSPLGVAVDATGNVYVADSGNFTIRKIATDGTVTTVAGSPGVSGNVPLGSASSTSAAARFQAPRGIIVDNLGFLYVADSTVIRRIAPDGTVTNWAGTAGTSGAVDVSAGNALTAQFNNPWKLALDSSGNMWVADRSNSRLRKVSPQGAVTTALYLPGLILGVAVDGADNVYMSIVGSVWKYYPVSGTLELLAGGAGAGALGSADGIGPAALWFETDGLAVNAAGRIYVTDAVGNTIRTGVAAPLPNIDSQPTGQAITLGGTVTFTVAASGTAPITYQWLKNGLPIADAVGAVLTLNNVQLADAASYSVQVTNVGGTVTSGSAILTVNFLPVISAQPQNVTANPGTPVVFSVGATGNPAPTYQWRKNTAPIPGASDYIYEIRGASAADAGSYDVVVTNSVGSVTSAAATLTVPTSLLPDISAQPVASFAAAGGGVSLSVTATGTGPFTYQWRKNDVAINGATNSTLELSGFTAASAGLYDVVVTNANGSTTSRRVPVGLDSPFLDEGFFPPQFASIILSTQTEVLSDGSFLISINGGGNATQLNHRGAGVVRYLANGTQDTNFDLNYPAEFGALALEALAVPGKFYAAVSSSRYTGTTGKTTIARFDNDGTLDSGYTPFTYANNSAVNSVSGLALQSDGKLLVTGSFTNFGGTGRGGIVRFNTDGSLDTSFAVTPMVPDGNGTGVQARPILQTVNADEKIIVAGGFRSFYGVTLPGIARLNSDGTLDTTFVPSGFSRNGGIRGMVLQSTGKIVLGGRFTVNGVGYIPFIRLNTDGSLDSSFVTFTVPPVLVGQTSNIFLNNDMAALPNDKFAGAVFTLYVCNADGSLVPTSEFTPPVLFNAVTASTSSSVPSVSRFRHRADGSYVLTGSFTHVNGITQPGAAILAADGTVQPFPVDPTASMGMGFSFVRTGNGHTLWAFAPSYNNDVPVVDLLADGLPAPTPFSPTLSSAAITAWLAQVGDGRIFALTGDSSGNRLVQRLLPNGAPDPTLTTTAAPAGQAADFAVVQPDFKTLITGRFPVDQEIINGESLRRLNVDGSLDTSYTAVLDDVATPVRGTPLAGESVGPLVSVPRLSLEVLAVDANNKAYVRYPASNGLTRLARLNANGSPDTSFAIITTPSMLSSATSALITDPLRPAAAPASITLTLTSRREFLDVAVQPGGKLVVAGQFNALTINGVTTAVSGLARLNGDGTLDASFNSGGVGPAWTTTVPYNASTEFPAVEAMAQQPDGRIILAGNFEAYNGTVAPGLTRINADGTLDTSYVPPVVRNPRFGTWPEMKLQDDRSVLLMGAYVVPGENFPRGLVRLFADTPPAITQQPQSQSVGSGVPVTLSVSVSAPGAVTYQWLKNGTPIAGATAADYTIAQPTGADSGTYSVVVTSLGGVITSSGAVLTVSTTVSILDQPTSRRAVAGSKVLLRVSASSTVGGATLTYQWRKNGANIAGATASDFTIGSVAAGDAGSYSVIVSDGTGATASATAVLTVLTPDNVLWQQFTEFSTEQADARTIHDGHGHVYLSWNATDRNADMVAGREIGALVRLNESDGTIDPTFKLDPRYRHASHVAFQSDGKLIIAVTAGDADTVIRTDSTGAVDSTFAAPLFARGIRFAALQPDGKVLVTAADNLNPDAPAAALATAAATIYRLNTSGTLDSGFTPAVLSDGSVIFGPPVLDTSNRIYLTGTFQSVNGTARVNIARLATDGTLDAAYANPSTLPAGFVSPQARTVVFQNSGQAVFVGGFRYTGRGTSGNQIMAIRLTTAGLLDTTYHMPLRSELGYATVNNIQIGVRMRYAIAQLNDQLIGVADRLTRLNADGTVDTTVVSRAFSKESYWVSQGSDGRLYVPDQIGVAGNALTLQLWGNGVACFAPNGTPDESFQTGGWGRSTYPTSGAVLSDGRVWVAGAFNRSGSTYVPGLAQFAAGGGLTGTQVASGFSMPAGTVAAAGNDQVFAVVTPDFDSSETTASTLVRINANGTPDGTFTPVLPAGYVLGSANVYAAPGGKVMLAQAFIADQAALNGSTGDSLLRLNASGTRDTGYTPALSAVATVERGTNNVVTMIRTGGLNVAQVLTDGSALIVAAAVDGNLRLLRLTPTGAVDTTFIAPSFGSITPSVAFTGNVTDPVTSTTGQFNLSVYSATDLIHTAVQMPDGRVYVSGRFALSGSPRGLVRLNANGTLDTTFMGAGIAFSKTDAGPYVSSLAVDAAGRLYVGGRFDSFNGTAVAGLFRLNADGSLDTAWAPGFAVRDVPAAAVQLTVVGPKLYAFGTVAAPADAFAGPYRVTDIPPPPSITTAPAAANVLVGGSATFTVVAGGTGPFTYQWFKNDVAIGGATSASYTINPVSVADAASYTVAITGPTGTAVSTPVPLVLALPVITSATTATATAGVAFTYTITASNSPTAFAAAGLPAGLSFNSTSGVISGTPSAVGISQISLTATNAGGTSAAVTLALTVSAPVAPSITTQPVGATKRVGESVTFTVVATGTPTLTYQWKKGGTNIGGATDASLTLSNLQVSNAGSYTVVVSNGTAPDATSTAVTLTVNPALAFTLQPLDAPVVAGSTATFTVAATGLAPLVYQWYSSPTVGGTPATVVDSAGKIAGAQTAKLTISNAQSTDIGYYVCIVTETGGAFLSSSAAQLSIMPRVIKIVGQTAAPGATVVVPIQLVAAGNENALGFSLNFDPTQLTYVNMVVGAGAADATLNPNDIQAGAGQLGIALSKPANAVWAAGLQEVVKVTFTVNAAAANGTAIVFTYGDMPVVREVSTVTADPLACGFQAGAVTVLSGYEADMNGNGVVTITDWVKVGRYVAGLDPAPTGIDFMKADCAGRSTLGNGVLSITDWVQAGRYAAGLDPLTPVGGPTGP